MGTSGTARTDLTVRNKVTKEGTAERTYEKTHPWIAFQVDLRKFSHELWLLLGEARSKCEHLAGAPLQPDTAEELHVVYLAKGVQGTTAIEGNTLSQEEVEQQIRGKLKLPPSKQYLQREISNVFAALDVVWGNIRDKRPLPLNVTMIQTFNRMLLDGLELPEEVEPGAIRHHSVGVMGYRGAPAQDCEHLLNRLCDWLDEIDAGMPKELGLATAIIRAVVAHLYIAWIHPFGDGNGRTARLVEFSILSHAGVPTPAVHLLSNHYNQTRAEYYRQLDYASSSGGDIVGFLSYAVQGFVDGLREQINRVREQQLDVAWRYYVYETFKDGKPTPGTARCRDLVLDLSQMGAAVPRRLLTQITPRTAIAYQGKTSKTLARDLNRLRRMGLITGTRGGIRARKEIIEAFLPARAERSDPA